MRSRTIDRFVQAALSLHRPSDLPNVFLLSSPRSGSTWLMELICTQPGFGYCESPLDLRRPEVRERLGITDWADLHRSGVETILEPYFRGLISGTIPGRGSNPRRRAFRPWTRRLVFKLLQGAEDRIGWLADTFQGRVAYLIRHPIAVALSREQTPRLAALLGSEYRRHFSEAELALAERIDASGTNLERAVVAWCLENAVPLRDARADWAVVTYEQLVVEPAPVLARLAERLLLPVPDRMMSRIARPSAVIKKSSGETQKLLNDTTTAARSELVRKWRKRISPEEESRLMAIVERFAIDVYRPGEDFAGAAYWIGAAPASARSIAS
jgi:hypothetical protein